jgi:hypothetical protein
MGYVYFTHFPNSPQGSKYKVSLISYVYRNFEITLKMRLQGQHSLPPSRAF